MPRPDKIDLPLSAPHKLQANTRIVHGSHLKLRGEIQGVRLARRQEPKGWFRQGTERGNQARLVLVRPDRPYECQNRCLKTDAHGFARGHQVAVQLVDWRLGSGQGGQ
jgi:hypothetical protein